MSVPVKKLPRRFKKNRRAHHSLKEASAGKCKDCGAKTIPHRACAKCGKYKGKTVVDVAKRLLRTKRNQKHKAS